MGRSLIRTSESTSLALQALSILCHMGENRVSNGQLAERLDASEHSLAKVTQRLAKGGLLESQRGPTGGFRLCQSPEKISLLQIFEMVEGPIDPDACVVDNQNGSSQQPCILIPVYAAATEVVRQGLAHISLSEFAQQHMAE